MFELAAARKATERVELQVYLFSSNALMYLYPVVACFLDCFYFLQRDETERKLETVIKESDTMRFIPCFSLMSPNCSCQYSSLATTDCWPAGGYSRQPLTRQTLLQPCSRNSWTSSGARHVSRWVVHGCVSKYSIGLIARTDRHLFATILDTLKTCRPSHLTKRSRSRRKHLMPLKLRRVL